MENFIRDRSNAMQYNYRAESNYPNIVVPIDLPSKFHVSGMTANKAKKVIKTLPQK